MTPCESATAGKDGKDRAPRILYLDIARGLAVLFMFTQHCMLIHEYQAGDSEHLLSLAFTLLGTAPAAPVFMILMGAFQMKSHSSAKRQILRGVKLFALGWLLNLLRLPMLISEGEGGSVLISGTIFNILVFNDILQLAGLSYVLDALLKALMRRPFLPPVLLGAICLVSPYLWGMFPRNPLFLMLWGTGEMINFPLFPWAVYPLMGMYLGPLLLGGEAAADGGNAESRGRELTEEEAMPGNRAVSSAESVLTQGGRGPGPDRGLTRLALAGLVLITAGEILIVLEIVPVGDYSRSGLGVHLLITGFVFVWLRLCRTMERVLSPDKALVRTLVFLSRNITAVYFIQWILFAWSIIPLGANRQNPWVSALIGLAVFLMTWALLRAERVRRSLSFLSV